MYRCAACGSDKVVVGTVKDGYSFKKGVLGVAVFGAVGAVAGLDGKKHESYKCMACGMELAQPMDQATKMAIDDCVNYVEMRQMHSWSMLKYRYPYPAKSIFSNCSRPSLVRSITEAFTILSTR